MKAKYMFEEFLRIAVALNGVGITPTLMGSLGLEQVTKAEWDPKDIDIHVPGDPRGWEAPDEERIFAAQQIEQVMTVLGYELVDLHEFEFRRDGLSVEFGVIDTLQEFAGVEVGDLELRSKNGVEFYLPDRHQFLAIYRASSQDGYRNEHNNSKDFKKIEYLEDSLRAG
ncbi:hypothetical protein NQ015_06900 [Corynebacterium sp. 153RC1]|uniref:hypothetical protein n=1 Tax=Corynebacterium TaxID=1716 RepID=UPI00211D019E|nr:MULTISPECIES: hypothetical protein [unclassified Corynebacterium]MCQ9370726.1 hypothetical protein [Corynebacterium sp. 35RC1]MCQ9344304.1 hypothetical protein [Corynebacterium sp. 76QC2CO]MCQ9352658.1 hypothetical protein [Corynebacterium sp. 209RC1]MCQ9354842.1 hypothetical protein [Corynebacterium sp. 1222RC1]MCQ9357027.1 hypothetical protein [Corynebacterium sp. 122RC1]